MRSFVMDSVAPQLSEWEPKAKTWMKDRIDDLAKRHSMPKQEATVTAMILLYLDKLGEPPLPLASVVLGKLANLPGDVAFCKEKDV
jgi:hypothetical protein